MEVMLNRCCGLDVHKDQVTACVMIAEPGKKTRKQTRTFATFTATLVSMCRWLADNQVTHVGMESTGVYWMPVFSVLEEFGGFKTVVGNAQHIKNVPGRKTDVKDAEWIATLVGHGLVRNSYVPPKDLRAIRDLVRYRRTLVECEADERNRLQKLLESANIKLATVASDVFGKSGRKMLKALAEGEADPKKLAQMAEGLLRKKIPQLELAFDGKVREHHRFVLREQLQRIDDAEAAIARVEAQIDARMAPYEKQVELLCQIPGVKRTIAIAIIAEIGVDMSVFPTAGDLASWAGASPGNNETGGKKRRAAHRKGNTYLLSILVEAAMAGKNTKGTYYRDKYYRLRSRRGDGRAKVAIAHKIIVAAYHMLKTGASYKELGETYLDRIDQGRVAKNLVRRLERLGYQVSISKAA